MTKRLSRIIDGDGSRIARLVPTTELKAGQHARRDVLHRIVVVGGGAAGLELVTRLGERFGRRSRGLVTLVASGSIDPADHEVSDLAQARGRGFRSLCGEMIGLNRAAKTVHLAATRDDRGRQVTPLRSVGYDTLVIAVGVQEVLERLDGLEVDRTNQLLVGPTLQTTRDRDIFAIGDCAQAAHQQAAHQQAAHQQVAHVLRQIDHRFRGKPLLAADVIARFMYRSLATLRFIARALARRTRPKVKLH